MGSSQAMRKPDSPVSSMLKEPLQPALRKERGSQMSRCPSYPAYAAHLEMC